MSEKMVFFKVIVSDADRGQYEWDEWLEEALPDNLLDYKLQEIRVRIENSPTYLEHGHPERSWKLSWPLLLSFFPPSVGEHGLGVPKYGEESPGAVWSASLGGEGSLSSRRQPLESVLLVMHQPSCRFCCWRHSDRHRATSLPRSTTRPDIAAATGSSNKNQTQTNAFREQRGF